MTVDHFLKNNLVGKKRLKMSIIDKVTSDIKRCISFMDEGHYLLAVAFSLQTHLIDVFDFIPPLYIRGWGNGSEITYAEVISLMCQNPIRVGIMTNAALIATMIKKWKSTLTSDVAKINKNPFFAEIIRESNRKSGEARIFNKSRNVVTKKIHCSKIFYGSEDISDPELAATSLTVQIKKPPFPLEQFENLKKQFEDDHGKIISLCEAHKTDFETAYSNFSPIEGIDGYELLRWKSILTIARVLDSVGETNSLFDQLVELARDTIRERLKKKLFSEDIKKLVLYATFRFLQDQELKPLEEDGSYVAEALQKLIQEACGLKIRIESVGRILNEYNVIKARPFHRVTWETSEEKKRNLKTLNKQQGVISKEYKPVAGDTRDEKQRRLKICYVIDKKALENAVGDCKELLPFAEKGKLKWT